MMSEWQIAQAFTATLTSPDPGSASVTSSIDKGALKSRQTAARIVSFISPSFVSGRSLSDACFRGSLCSDTAIRIPTETAI